MPSICDLQLRRYQVKIDKATSPHMFRLNMTRSALTVDTVHVKGTVPHVNLTIDLKCGCITSIIVHHIV